MPKGFRNNRSTILVIIFLLVLSGLIFLNLNLNKAKILLVEITEESFSRSEIQITEGDTIVWINKGNKEHWPASDFHPTHTIYPTSKEGCIGSDLDSCKGLKTGEKYSFRFDVIGSWGLHDHLNPGLTMRVVVRKADQIGYFDKIKDAWNGLKNNFTTNEKDLSIEDLSKVNPQKAWEKLKKEYLINGVVVGNAHQLAHKVGNNAYQKLGFEAIFVCDKTFGYGCYHGVTEKMLAEVGPSKVNDIKNKCLEKFKNSDITNVTGCVHGMGHGLLTWENLNYQKALLDCDKLDSTYRNYCYDGVFMEFSFSAKNEAFDSNNPWQLCESINEQYQVNCARYQVNFFQSRFSWNFVQSAEGCQKTTKETLSETCFSSLGYLAAQNAIGNLGKIIEQCNSITNTQGKEYCLFGASNELVFQKYKGWEANSSELCNQLSNSLKAKCVESNKGVF